MDDRRSQRERDASAQSMHVAERGSAAIEGMCAFALPTRTRRLSEGVVVEASIMARLLKWRVLSIDASILLLPANGPPADGTIATPPRDTRSRRATSRGRLADAIKNIDHAENELARARHTNHTACL